MDTNTLTQEHLKEILHYNPDTGIFTWLIRIAPCIKIGKIAGHKHKQANSNKIYIVIRIHGTGYLAHRLAFFYIDGKWPENEVDHEEGNGLDNKWNNLRSVTHAVNQKNRKKGQNNKSGVPGVYFDKNIWRAFISINKKQTFISSSVDFFETVCARKSAEIKHGYHKNHGR